MAELKAYIEKTHELVDQFPSLPSRQTKTQKQKVKKPTYTFKNKKSTAVLYFSSSKHT